MIFLGKTPRSVWAAIIGRSDRVEEWREGRSIETAQASKWHSCICNSLEKETVPTWFIRSRLRHAASSQLTLCRNAHEIQTHPLWRLLSLANVVPHWAYFWVKGKNNLPPSET